MTCSRLSRRSTPAEGGFCTFQPVVDGGACPWNLNCHSCDRFVLSGADLLYWRRKREQWRLLAEGAPDDATATYLHNHFEPTARAIDGLEKALAGLGLGPVPAAPSSKWRAAMVTSRLPAPCGPRAGWRCSVSLPLLFWRIRATPPGDCGPAATSKRRLSFGCISSTC